LFHLQTFYRQTVYLYSLSQQITINAIVTLDTLVLPRGKRMTRATKTEKILILKPYGKYLTYSNMNFIIKNKKRTTEKEIAFHKVGEIILQSGNAVSTGALASAGFWGIDLMIMTSSGRPVATMITLDDCSHVKTRICQYEVYKSRKGVEIAKQFVLGKIEAQTQMLKKYSLTPFETFDIPSKEQIALLYAENIDKIRNKLHAIEAKYSQHYFQQIISLFPKKLRKNWKKREGFRAYDELNNVFNFAYELLKWKIFRALIKAKLEPYLGYLHTMQEERPNLVCDFQEIYRCLVDDFLIKYSQKLKQKHFKKYYEKEYHGKKTPRIYLNHLETNNLVENLNRYFETKIEIPRIRRGKKQTIGTLINEETILFAMYLRKEKPTWTPRILIPQKW